MLVDLRKGLGHRSQRTLPRPVQGAGLGEGGHQVGSLGGAGSTPRARTSPARAPTPARMSPARAPKPVCTSPLAHALLSRRARPGLDRPVAMPVTLWDRVGV